MDGMIRTGRFCEFVGNVVKASNKEKEDKMNWEFWLHKVFEGTFNDFLKEIETNEQNQSMSKQAIETTVQNSLDILKDFKPT